jgi:hypothetical protein
MDKPKTLPIIDRVDLLERQFNLMQTKIIDNDTQIENLKTNVKQLQEAYSSPRCSPASSCCRYSISTSGSAAAAVTAKVASAGSTAADFKSIKPRRGFFNHSGNNININNDILLSLNIIFNTNIKKSSSLDRFIFF